MVCLNGSFTKGTGIVGYLSNYYEPWFQSNCDAVLDCGALTKSLGYFRM